VAGSSKQGNGTLDSIKDCEYVDQLNDYQLEDGCLLGCSAV
jgi:hypothetical protein